MIDVAFAYAFTVGMVTTVNPCGFAMLPAYLSYFLGLGPGGASPGGTGAGTGGTERSLGRALAVGLTVSLGFVVVFGGLGFLFNLGLSAFQEYVRYVTIGIGGILVALGVAMLAGRKPRILTPKLEAGGRDRTFASMLLFGISYAVASISCAFGPFIAVVVNSFGRTNWLSGALTFVAYAAGMATVLIALTVSLAMAKQGLVRNLRRALPIMDRVSGVLLVLSGLFLIVYWITVINGDRNAVVDRVEGWSEELQRLFNDWGAGRLGLAFAAVILAAVVVVVVRRRRSAARRSAADTRSPAH
jgi:cytochrome c-type biogenesis protein